MPPKRRKPRSKSVDLRKEVLLRNRKSHSLPKYCEPPTDPQELVTINDRPNFEGFGGSQFPLGTIVISTSCMAYLEINQRTSQITYQNEQAQISLSYLYPFIWTFLREHNALKPFPKTTLEDQQLNQFGARTKTGFIYSLKDTNSRTIRIRTDLSPNPQDTITYIWDSPIEQ